MKHLLIRLLTGLLSFAAFASASRAEHPPQWNKGAENVAWRWDERLANPITSAMLRGSKYDVRITTKKNNPFDLDIVILEGERELYSIKGHTSTVFNIFDDRLFFADFSPATTGATIVAVDLKTQKELWRSSVLGIEIWGHFGYNNSLNLSGGGDSISVFGNESFGQYYESKRSDTGETTAHKLFTEEEIDPVAINVRRAVQNYHVACIHGDLERVKRLLAAGLDVNARETSSYQTQQEKTALHAAARSSTPAVVEFLLNQGHAIDPRDRDQKTPLHLAIQNAMEAAAPGQPEEKTRVLHETGLTALQGALKSCQILLQRGAASTPASLATLRQLAEASDDQELLHVIEQVSAPKPATPPAPPKP
ncbi:MAG: ankyrin repeat domain-containing protein [Verrucomicrobiaceae bacterium]|nr:ankyrin repeat domain-containing protein [Verrucomicrobiaceae bacterium]